MSTASSGAFSGALPFMCAVLFSSRCTVYKPMPGLSTASLGYSQRRCLSCFSLCVFSAVPYFFSPASIFLCHRDAQNTNRCRVCPRFLWGCLRGSLAACPLIYGCFVPKSPFLSLQLARCTTLMSRSATGSPHQRLSSLASSRIRDATYGLRQHSHIHAFHTPPFWPCSLSREIGVAWWCG